MTTLAPALPRLDALVSETTTTSPYDTPRFYRPELDGLRFLAALGVFLFHALPSDVAPLVERGVPLGVARVFVAIVQTGGAGVDFFFALSAFLITELLWRELEKDGTIAYQSFLVRRALRIWPLYFLFLLVATNLLPAALTGETMRTSGVLAFTFFVGNWYSAVNGFIANVAMPLWSVSIEEQFYVVWPLIVRRLGMSVRAATRLALLMVVFSTCARAVAVFAGLDGSFLWCSTVTRLDAIAAGVLAGAAYRSDLVPRGALACVSLLGSGAVAMVCGSALIRSQAHWAHPDLADVFAYVLVAFGCVGVLLGVLTGPARLRNGLGTSVMTYLGRISYGFYVFHILGIRIIDTMITSLSGGRYLLAHVVGGFIATLVLAMASYRLVEMPFLRLKRRFQRIVSGASIHGDEAAPTTSLQASRILEGEKSSIRRAETAA